MDNDDPTFRLKKHKYFAPAIQALLEHPFKQELKSIHAAVIVRGGSILSCATNSPNQNNYILRFAPHPQYSLHGEIASILKARKKIDLCGCKMYVARLDKNGYVSMSRPCIWCQKIIKKHGIKKVYYTTENGLVNSENVSNF